MIRMFTNRRRAKDALQVIDEKFDLESVTVFVMAGEVYIHVEVEHPDMDTILHFGAIPCTQEISLLLNMEHVTELYKGEEARRFRV